MLDGLLVLVVVFGLTAALILSMGQQVWVAWCKRIIKQASSSALCRGEFAGSARRLLSPNPKRRQVDGAKCFRENLFNWAAAGLCGSVGDWCDVEDVDEEDSVAMTMRGGLRNGKERRNSASSMASYACGGEAVSPGERYVDRLPRGAQGRCLDAPCPSPIGQTGADKWSENPHGERLAKVVLGRTGFQSSLSERQSRREDLRASAILEFPGKQTWRGPKEQVSGRAEKHVSDAVHAARRKKSMEKWKSREPRESVETGESRERRDSVRRGETLPAVARLPSPADSAPALLVPLPICGTSCESPQESSLQGARPSVSRGHLEKRRSSLGLPHQTPGVALAAGAPGRCSGGERLDRLRPMQAACRRVQMQRRAVEAFSVPIRRCDCCEPLTSAIIRAARPDTCSPTEVCTRVPPSETHCRGLQFLARSYSFHASSLPSSSLKPLSVQGRCPLARQRSGSSPCLLGVVHV